MTRSTHGGRRPNQTGRPRKPLKEKRVKAAVTLHPDHAAALPKGKSAAHIDLGLAIAIPALAAPSTPGRTECLTVYHAVGHAIQALERRRDIDPQTSTEPADGRVFWTDEEAQLHDLLSGVWDALRFEPTFWEPALPEEY